MHSHLHTRGVPRRHNVFGAFLIVLMATASSTALWADLAFTLASGSTSSAGYRYAQYEISGAGIRFFSHDLPGPIEGNLIWTSTPSNDEGVEFVNVTLSIANFTLTLGLNCTNNRLFFNRTYSGANIFNVSGLEAGKSVDLSSSSQSQVGVAKGPYQTNTPYGWYSYWLVEIQAPLLNSTILSGYLYETGTGLLIGENTPANWLLNLFGIEAIFANMRLSSTNIDLGSSDILSFVGAIYPILFWLMIFTAIVFIYRRKHTHRRGQTRRHGKPQ